jgi:hypothetical protein
VPIRFVHRVNLARNTVDASMPAREEVSNLTYALVVLPTCRKGRVPKLVEGYVLFTCASPTTGSNCAESVGRLIAANVRIIAVAAAEWVAKRRLRVIMCEVAWIAIKI